MPSPFPGMDPYLENPGLWPDVHHRLITIASDRLGELLRPKYLVRIEERVYVADEEEGLEESRARVPDLRVAERPGWEGATFRPGGGVAVEEVAEPVVARTLIEEEAREAYLVVIDRELRSVVTVIEVLSPTNKVPGSHGLSSFEQKRLEVMTSPSHWVEIDLLRQGVSLSARHDLATPCEYLVHVSRVAQRPQGQLWPIRLSQRLPVVPVPVKPEDPDAPLDLQAALATVYDRAGYDLEIDYRRDPVPPLDGPWAEWADRWLKQRGVR